MPSAPPPPAGVAAVSRTLYDRVTQYHAAIGPEVSQAELSRHEQKLLEEARKHCIAHRWDEALELFAHALAVTEKSKTKFGGDAGGRGTLIHNIAFCLHCMGEFEAARAHYEQSLECFSKVTFPLHQRLLNGLLYPERVAFELMYGGLNHNRIIMTKERLLDLSFNRKPDLQQLDEFGRRKPMPNGTEGTAIAQASSWTPPSEPVGDERKPGWLASTQERDAEAEAEASSPPAGREAPSAQASGSRDAAEEEAARREWLAYHMQVGEWAQAEELVVTEAERKELDQRRARG